MPDINFIGRERGLAFIITTSLLSLLFIVPAYFNCLPISYAEKPLFKELSWEEIVITDKIQLDNKLIICRGNLTIANGGYLRISNSTLIIVSESNESSSTITVENGGTLELVSTKLRSNGSSAYTIYLNGSVFGETSNCYIDSCEIRNCGCYAEEPSGTFKKGVMVKSLNFTIKNTLIYSEYFCIVTQEVWGAMAHIENVTLIANFTFSSGEVRCGIIFDLLIPSNVTILNSSFYCGPAETTSPIFSGAQFRFSPVSISNSTFYQVQAMFREGLIKDSHFYLWGKSYNDERSVCLSNSLTRFENCVFETNFRDGISIVRAMGRFINCTFKHTDYDFNFPYTRPENYFAAAELLNTSVESYNISNPLGMINFSYFLNIDVISEDGLRPIGDATIEIFNGTNRKVFEGRTLNDGTLYWIPLIWRSVTPNLQTTYTPYKVVVKRDGVSAVVSGVSMTENRNITIYFDDIKPDLTITYPPEGLLTNSSSINIIGTTEPGARVTVNGEMINNIDGIINQTWWLNEGLNTLVIQARDAAGNVAEVIRNVTLDQTGPYVTIVDPPDGLVTNKNPIEVKGRTNGTRLEVAGKEVEISPNGTFSTTFTFPFEGQHSIMAMAWDDAGNTGMHRVRVEWDATPPAIEIESPQDGSLTNDKNLEIKGTVNGASVATLNGVPLDLRRDGAFEHPVELMEGENVFLIEARDAAGNENSTTLIVYLDTKNFIEILEPADSALLNTSSIVVRGRTEAGAAVSVNGIDAAVENGSFSLALDLNEGANKITAISLDRAGNKAEATVRVTVDTTPPPIVIISPLERVLKVANVELRIQSEPGAVVTVNGEPVGGTGGIFALPVVLEKGENRFVIEARDAARNVNTTELVLSYSPPKPPPPAPSAKTDWLLPVVVLILIGTAGAGYIALRLRKRRTGEGPGPPGPP